MTPKLDLLDGIFTSVPFFIQQVKGRQIFYEY